jgi:2-polyprenyl-6-methoxyphenol hydroxylase-like FAD-dependent oxidoreductase
MAVNQFSNSRLGDSYYDLIIVGGGMVGASLSLLLASRGIRKILIIESQSMDFSQSSHSSYSSSFDARSTALSWTSRDIYQSIGIWEQLEKNLSRIDQIHVSDRHHGGLTRMSASDEGIDALGYVVENAWLGSILIDQLKKIRCGCSFANSSSKTYSSEKWSRGKSSWYLIIS